MHIKACLAMQDLGVSAEVIPPTHSICRRTDEHSIQRSELPPTSNHPSCMEEGPCDSEKPVGNMVGHYISEISEGEGLIHADNSTSPKQPLVYTNDLLSSSKRQKVDASEGENSLALELTESSMLNWLKNYNDRVSGLPENIILKSNCLHIQKKGLIARCVPCGIVDLNG